MPAQFQARQSGMLDACCLFRYLLTSSIRCWADSFELTPLRKIGIGMFLTARRSPSSRWPSKSIDAGQTAHMMWQIVAYMVLTAAEVMVSITALEFSYTQAPREDEVVHHGRVSAVRDRPGQLFVTAEVNGYLDKQKKAGSAMLEGASYFWFFTC